MIYSIAARTKRHNIRIKAIEYLGGECHICKYKRCDEALDFHHVDPLEKDFNISSKLSSWKKIVFELSKCILLCATCHREVHAGYHGTRYLEDDAARRQDY